MGAIIGSPFMLATFSLFLMGLVLIFQKRKKLELNLDIKEILKNYKYFIFAYVIAISTSFVQNTTIKISAVAFLLATYAFYVYRTIDKSKKCFCEKCIDELAFLKFFKDLNRSKEFCICFQLFISIILLVISVHFFVKEIVFFSNVFDVSPFLLSFIITPFATELPECVNSVIWLRQDKDDLALGNILGAVVFQATVLFSVGILLTSWALDFSALLNSIVVLISSIIFILSMLIYKKVKLFSLLLMGIFYFGYLFFVIR